MLNVRINKELEKALENLASLRNVTKSEIVKEALTEYVKTQSSTPYEAGKDLFGSDKSNIHDGSVKYKENIRRKISEKHSD
ncbi:MAG: ribbon-helix-helix protein, CopG family [Bacillota bacterium]